MTLVVSENGETQEITTIEQANYWLRKKWPITDLKRSLAIESVDAAMHCLTTVEAARQAFIRAAQAAGYRFDDAGPQADTLHGPLQGRA